MQILKCSCVASFVKFPSVADSYLFWNLFFDLFYNLTYGSVFIQYSVLFIEAMRKFDGNPILSAVFSLLCNL